MNKYNLRIDFRQNSAHPSRVFTSMAEVIDAFELFDKMLIESLGYEITSNLVLQDIEKGSLKAILKCILQLPDKEALRAGEYKKVIGRLLDDGRNLLLEKLGKNSKVDDIVQIEEIQNDLYQIVVGSESLLLLKAPNKISLLSLFKCLKTIENPIKNLEDHENISYKSEKREEQVIPKISIGEDLEEKILSKSKNKISTKSVLTVKKPDLLGNSQWDFILDNKVIRAHIKDTNWLNELHKRSVMLKSGDAVEATISIYMLEDSEGNYVGQKYIVEEIIKVIENTTPKQTDFTTYNGNWITD